MKKERHPAPVAVNMNTSTCVHVFSPGKPDPCEKIEVLEITKNSATVGWIKPARDGGAKIDGYVIEYIEVKPPPPETATAVEVCQFIQYCCHAVHSFCLSVAHNYHIYSFKKIDVVFIILTKMTTKQIPDKLSYKFLLTIGS